MELNVRLMIECFTCGKSGHFKGAKSCRGKKKGKGVRRVDGRKNKDEDEGNTHSASSDEDEVEVKSITKSRIQPAKFVAHVRRSGTRGEPRELLDTKCLW